MAYDFYIGDMLLPVPPEKLTIKIKGGNKTYTMMNEGQINVLKSAELTEISFDMFLPNHQYPFAVYKPDVKFQTADYYLDILERLKVQKRTFQFIVSRVQNGKLLFDTNIKCSLEDYSIVEDAGKYGTDVMVSVSLKQYQKYGVKKCKVKTKKKLSMSKLRDSKYVNLDDSFIMLKGNTVVDLRKVDGIIGKVKAVHIVIKKTITLYNLAKKIYGKGSLYTILQDCNKVSTLKCTKNASGEAGDTVHKLKKDKTAKLKKSQKLYPGMYLYVPIEYWS